VHPGPGSGGSIAGGRGAIALPKRVRKIFLNVQLPPATLKRAATMQFRCLVNRGTMGVNSLPKTVIPDSVAAAI